MKILKFVFFLSIINIQSADSLSVEKNPVQKETEYTYSIQAPVAAAWRGWPRERGMCRYCRFRSNDFKILLGHLDQHLTKIEE